MTTSFIHRKNTEIYGWILVGIAAYLGLPWYFLQSTPFLSALAGLFGGSEGANGITHAIVHGRLWLWTGIAGLAVAAAAPLMKNPRHEGMALVWGGLIGVAGLLLSGFVIGVNGWSYEWPAKLFGSLERGQYGLGWGGMTVLLSLLMVISIGIARLGFFRGEVFVASAVVLCSALLILFVVFPVAHSFVAAFLDEDGRTSPAALLNRIGTSRMWTLACLANGASACGVAWNTLFLALMTAAGTVVLGTMLALLAERGPKRASKALNALAVLPIITPPFVVGLGLILLFGRAGMANQFMEWAFNVTPTRWFYGLFGVWLAQMFSFTPIAFLIMRGVVQGISPSLEEAAQTLRADRSRTFWSITLPLLKPGLANAFLVGFIESIADFGNPIVVGGQYAVLSTEIFFAIVGAQLDQGLAAALALVLTVFALGVFFIQRAILGGQSFTTVSGKGDAGVPMELPKSVIRACLFIGVPWLFFTVVIYAFSFAGGFVKLWGRDYTFTLDHFSSAFSFALGASGIDWTGTAWHSLFTTIKLAAIAAPVCAVIGLMIAWLLARTEFRGQRVFEFCALLAFAIPGTVLGVSYVLAFNVPPFELTGTGLIIVLCFVFRNLPVGVRAGTAAFKQLDRSLDEASLMLRAGTATTLRRIVLPLLKSALVAALVYSFVRSMTTVSAVIFLVTAENEVATSYIIGRVGNGDYGVALAYCTVLILLMSVATYLIQVVVGDRKLGRRRAGAQS